MLTASRFLDPRADLVFKKIFQHPDLLMSFLNNVMPLLDPVIDLTYLPAEQAPTIPELKRPIVDVRCTDATGRIFIVEMQIEWTPDFAKRILYTVSQSYVNQLDRGQHYRHLCPVYGLALLNENCDNSEGWYHHYSLRHAQHVDKKLEGLEIVLLELKKFQPRTWAEKRLGVLWLRFLRELKDWQSIPVEFADVPEIVKACELAQESAYSKAELAFYDKFWDSVSSEITLMEGREERGFARGMEKGMEKGKEEGILEGEKRAQLATARRMIEAGMSVEQIALLTGLAAEDLCGIR